MEFALEGVVDEDDVDGGEDGEERHLVGLQGLEGEKVGDVHDPELHRAGEHQPPEGGAGQASDPQEGQEHQQREAPCG